MDNHAVYTALETESTLWHRELTLLIEARNPAGAATVALVFDEGPRPTDAGHHIGELAAADPEGNRELVEQLLRESDEADEFLRDAYLDGRVSLQHMLSLPFDYKIATRDPVTGEDDWEFGLAGSAKEVLQRAQQQFERTED